MAPQVKYPCHRLALLKAIAMHWLAFELTFLRQTIQGKFQFWRRKNAQAIVINARKKVSYEAPNSFSHSFKFYASAHVKANFLPTYPFYRLRLKFSARSDQTIN